GAKGPPRRRARGSSNEEARAELLQQPARMVRTTAHETMALGVRSAARRALVQGRIIGRGRDGHSEIAAAGRPVAQTAAKRLAGASRLPSTGRISTSRGDGVSIHALLDHSAASVS